VILVFASLLAAAMGFIAPVPLQSRHLQAHAPTSLASTPDFSASDVLADLEELDQMAEDEEDEDDIKEPGQAAANRLAIQAAIEKYRRHEKDGGSPEVQIAICTEKILYLTTHLKTHPKDLHSTRGLRSIIERRKTQLNYLFKKKPAETVALAKELGIRFRPKLRYQSKEDKYASFKNTKQIRYLKKQEA